MKSLAMTVKTCAISTAYDFLSQYLTFANRDHYEWWTYKGPLLSQFLQDCDYSIHQQYQYLTLFHNHLIPGLGAYTEPTVGQQGNTLLSGAGKLEIDRTFTAKGSSLRIAFEPTSHLAQDHGTDPLNVLPLPQLVSSLRQVPGVHIGIDPYRVLVGRLTTSDLEEPELLQNPKLHQQLQTLPSRTQNILALDLVDGVVQPTLYFQPQLKALATGSDVKKMLFGALQELNVKEALTPALKLAEEFLGASPATTQPLFLSTDLSSAARQSGPVPKLFLIDGNITWERAETMWTWGRTIKHGDMRPLCVLWNSLQVVEGPRSASEFPMMMAMKLCEEPPFVRPQVALPAVGMTEQAIGEAVVRFFTAMGWSDHAASYMNSLHSY
jgi:DMATS type aromatic prenyltransferase